MPPPSKRVKLEIRAKEEQVQPQVRERGQARVEKDQEDPPNQIQDPQRNPQSLKLEKGVQMERGVQMGSTVTLLELSQRFVS